MTARRRASRSRWIRLALVVAMVVLAAVIGGLYVLGQRARPRSQAEEPAPPTAPGVAGDPEAAVLSEGFDYEQQIEGEPVFRLQGDRFLTDREGRVQLEGVELTLFREGDPYRVISERATYFPDTQAARLEGDVRLEGAGGWTIGAEQLELPAGERVVVSGGGRASFARGEGLRGGAQRLRYDLDAERLELEGKVKLSGSEQPGEPRIGLLADHVEWRRDDNALSARDRVHLSWGESVLSADRLEATLLSEGGGFETASALGEVRGELHGESGERGELAAERAEMAFEPATGDPTALALSSSGPRSAARFHLQTADGDYRRMAAPEIRLAMSGGQPREADAWGGVVLEQRAADAPARVARAEKLHAQFGAGAAIASAELDGGVVIHDGELRAAGERAVLEDGGSRATLTGAPATARNPRGQMSAPRLVYLRGGSQLRAEDGVRARFEPGSEGLPGAGESREPIAVEAREGSFALEPRGFEFAGTVQAVQGDTLLFADRLTGDEATGRSRATGQVRTVWTDRGSTAGAAATSTIHAETLDYARDAGVLTYAGDVRVRQGGRELRAEEVVVELDDAGSAESMVASGGVVIEDRASGRKVEGARADYDLVARSAVVTGEPVVLREASGTVLQGRRALFDLDTGSARLLSETP